MKRLAALCTIAAIFMLLSLIAVKFINELAGEKRELFELRGEVARLRGPPEAEMFVRNECAAMINPVPGTGMMWCFESTTSTLRRWDGRGWAAVVR